MELKIKKTQPKGVFMLLLTAFIWGSSFVAQSMGMESVGAFTFSSIRTSMGVIALVPVLWIAYYKNKSIINKRAVINGIFLGLIFTPASLFQQYAFNYSTAGKIAFITALYMFIVPVIGTFSGKRLPLLTWICVFCGLVGLFFLCIDPKNPGKINKGDALAFVCAIGFAVHIEMTDRYSNESNGIVLSFTQFFVCSIISTILMFIFEKPEIQPIKAAFFPMLYSGVLSCSVAYTFQIIGQKYTESTVASLVMCMESVFAVLMSALLLKQRLSVLEFIGCTVMFMAIVVSQIAEASLTKKQNRNYYPN